MTAAPFRCSTASLASTEPLLGTASTVRSFVLLETPGPWGVHAVREARLPDEVRTRLLRMETDGVRPLLIRRPRRSTGGGVKVFSALADAAVPRLGSTRLGSTELGDVRDFLDLDLDSLPDHAGVLYGVCTHGRHDACCAELGRPLAGALSTVAPEETWEVSHIGGDRFAPNVLVLPHGLYYGRLLPAEAEQFVEAHRSGRLDLEHLRGRSSYPFAVQAAEIHLRRRIGERRIGALSLVSATRAGAETAAVFDVASDRWQVRVRTERSAPARLTCRASSPSTGLTHTLVAIDVLPA